MTGKSDLSARCRKYYKKIGSGVMLIAGIFLVLEHLFVFNGFDIELLGHEWYGLILIIGGILLSLKWEQVRGVREAWKDRNLHKLLDQGERE